MLNKSHALIVDTANLKGPKLSQLFDSTTEILLKGSVSTIGQITLTFIKICWEIIELWCLKNSGPPYFCMYAVSSIKHQRVVNDHACSSARAMWASAPSSDQPFSTFSSSLRRALLRQKKLSSKYLLLTAECNNRLPCSARLVYSSQYNVQKVRHVVHSAQYLFLRGNRGSFDYYKSIAIV